MNTKPQMNYYTNTILKTTLYIRGETDPTFPCNKNV